MGAVSRSLTPGLVFFRISQRWPIMEADSPNHSPASPSRPPSTHRYAGGGSRWHFCPGTLSAMRGSRVLRVLRLSSLPPVPRLLTGYWSLTPQAWVMARPGGYSGPRLDTPTTLVKANTPAQEDPGRPLVDMSSMPWEMGSITSESMIKVVEKWALSSLPQAQGSRGRLEGEWEGRGRREGRAGRPLRKGPSEEVLKAPGSTESSKDR